VYFEGTHELAFPCPPTSTVLREYNDYFATPYPLPKLDDIAAPGRSALARRALDLALTPEPGATTSAGMIAGVAEEHPDLAFDFAMAHLAAVDQRVDASSRSRYYATLAARSADPAMIDNLKAYAAANLEETSRRDTDTAAAGIRDRIRVRGQVLPAIDAWLARRAT